MSEKYICIAMSTAHMTLDDKNKLDATGYIERAKIGRVGKNSGMIMARDTGYFVKLYDELDYNFRPVLSPAFNEAIKFVHRQGARLVEFDSDAPIEPSLETFDW